MRRPCRCWLTPSQGHLAVFELTNPDLKGDMGEVRLRKEGLGIRREKCLGDDYTETITVHNYMSEPAEFSLAYALRSRFRRYVRRPRHAPG